MVVGGFLTSINRNSAFLTMNELERGGDTPNKLLGIVDVNTGLTTDQDMLQNKIQPNVCVDIFLCTLTVLKAVLQVSFCEDPGPSNKPLLHNSLAF